MEGVLVQAVRLGAEEVSTEMERFEPAGVTVLSGVPRARGFVLDGYGVFFDVEIPDMNQSVIWSMMNVQRDRQVGNALDSLRSAIQSIPDGPNRQQAQGALEQVTKTVGPAMPPRGPQGQPAPSARTDRGGHRDDARSQRPLFRSGEGRTRRRDARPQPPDEPRSRRVADAGRACQRRPHASSRVCRTSSRSCCGSREATCRSTTRTRPSGTRFVNGSKSKPACSDLQSRHAG